MDDASNYSNRPVASLYDSDRRPASLDARNGFVADSRAFADFEPSFVVRTDDSGWSKCDLEWLGRRCDDAVAMSFSVPAM